MFKKYIYRNGILYGPGPINEKNFDKLHKIAQKYFTNEFNKLEHSLGIKHEHGYSYAELF